MANFEYGFTLKLIDNEHYQLTFLDIPSLVVKAPTVEKIFEQAQSLLDDYLYVFLKEGKKIPLPKKQAPRDKRISPSDPVKMALSYVC